MIWWQAARVEFVKVFRSIFPLLRSTPRGNTRRFLIAANFPLKHTSDSLPIFGQNWVKRKPTKSTMATALCFLSFLTKETYERFCFSCLISWVKANQNGQASQSQQKWLLPTAFLSTKLRLSNLLSEPKKKTPLNLSRARDKIRIPNSRKLLLVQNCHQTPSKIIKIK